MGEVYGDFGDYERFLAPKNKANSNPIKANFGLPTTPRGRKEK